MCGHLRLLNIACAAKAKPRLVTLTKPSRDSPLAFSLLGGQEKGFRIFIDAVEPGSKAAEAGLKRGDQVLYLLFIVYVVCNQPQKVKGLLWNLFFNFTLTILKSNLQKSLELKLASSCGHPMLALYPPLDFSTIFTLCSPQGFKQSPLILEPILRVSGCALSPLDSKHPCSCFPKRKQRSWHLWKHSLSLCRTLHTFQFL